MTMARVFNASELFVRCNVDNCIVLRRKFVYCFRATVFASFDVNCSLLIYVFCFPQIS